MFRWRCSIVLMCLLVVMRICWLFMCGCLLVVVCRVIGSWCMYCGWVWVCIGSCGVVRLLCFWLSSSLLLVVLMGGVVIFCCVLVVCGLVVYVLVMIGICRGVVGLCRICMWMWCVICVCSRVW